MTLRSGLVEHSTFTQVRDDLIYLSWASTSQKFEKRSKFCIVSEETSIILKLGFKSEAARYRTRRGQSVSMVIWRGE